MSNKPFTPEEQAAVKQLTDRLADLRVRFDEKSHTILYRLGSETDKDQIKYYARQLETLAHETQKALYEIEKQARKIGQ